MTLRASFLRAALLWVATFGVVFMATEARAQAPSKPAVVGTAMGTITVSQGAAWDDIVIGDWAGVSTYAIPSTGRIVELVVKNTHATQALYVMLKTGGATATTDAIYVGPLSAQTIPTWAMAVTTISVQGAGAATTARIDSTWAAP